MMRGGADRRAPAQAQAAAGGVGLAREVRIIGGSLRRSKLQVPLAPGLRPTPDRVRETLFNWLGQTLVGWRCLDAFAGSGALGFEAASRGAADVLLLEQDPAVAKALAAARARLKVSTLRIQEGDAFRLMPALARQGEAFDLVFLDPPFALDASEAALQAAMPLLAPKGFLYLEAAQPLCDAALQRLGLAVWRQGRAGAVCFSLLHPS
jgi:16S rRNA (guanine966-N2)-methyltransferase